MDPQSFPVRAAETHETDDWDADGFEIPSLKPATSENAFLVSKEQRPFQELEKEKETLYLGPYGAPPSKVKQELNCAAGRKQKFKQKLKEAEKKRSSSGYENKVENLRDLMGGKMNPKTIAAPSNEWLDPFCHESQFERKSI
eukprot:TRINITY_DN5059_c0_g1_i3.p1 TRINITY_DN5059_c0_g1~~TRINITY_DN5059_c0_g1_i3.p1  ORF type:complete len:142 (-),score=38.58 TRINITY_DN5059_c0_g1_i3:155-580(-)